MTRARGAQASAAALAAVLVLVSACAHPQPVAGRTDHAARLVRQIVLGRDRGAALCQLMALKRYHRTPRYEDDPCRRVHIRHLERSPTDDGEMFAAVVESAYVDSAVPHAGLLVQFDSAGFLVPVFAGANLLQVSPAFLRYRGDQRRAVIHEIPTDAGDGLVALVLHVVPLTPDQRPVLSVVVGPAIDSFESCNGFPWSWRVTDADADGRAEIEIGPNVANGLAPRATYRWSEDKQSYDGPHGSVAEGFMRFQEPEAPSGCCSTRRTDDPVVQFGGEQVRLGITPDLTGPRTSRCRDTVAVLPSVGVSGAWRHRTSAEMAWRP